MPRQENREAMAVRRLHDAIAGALRGEGGRPLALPSLIAGVEQAVSEARETLSDEQLLRALMPGLEGRQQVARLAAGDSPSNDELLARMRRYGAAVAVVRAKLGIAAAGGTNSSREEAVRTRFAPKHRR